jgi:hypothetical protein
MTELKPVTVEVAYARSLPALYARHPRHEQPQPVAMLCRYDGQALRATYELLFEDGCKRVLRGEDFILVAEERDLQPE